MSFNSYNFTTGIGFQPYLLKHLRDVAGTGNDPQLKINNIGFLNMLSDSGIISRNRTSAPGAVDFIQVAYEQRWTPEMTKNDDSCGDVVIDPKKEVSVDLNVFRRASIFIDDALMQSYMDDSNRTQSMGLPPTPLMGEMINKIQSAANGILSALDKDLLNNLIIGTNTTTGSNVAKTINIDPDITQLSLGDGVTEILSDTVKNQFATGTPYVVGYNLMLNYFHQQAAKGLQFNGLDTRIESNGFSFFPDQYVPGVLATNDIVVVSPGSVKLVEFNRFTGVYGGQKGADYFGTISLPLQLTINKVIPVSFDYQLSYLPCPEATADVNDYYGTPLTSKRGWRLTLSKTAGLFQVPSDAYRTGDDLLGVNGVLRYSITNV